MSLILWLFKIFIAIMVFLFTNVTLNIAQVFGLIFILLGFFSSIEPSGWIASSMIFLMTFVFFGDLGLRLIINERKIMRLSLIFINVSILVFPISVIFVFFD